MIKYYIAILFVGLLFTIQEEEIVVNSDSSVAEVEEQLGVNYTEKKPDFSIPGVNADVGRDIIFYGMSTDKNGKKLRKQSKHFVCTSCHNTVNEEYDLANPNPEDRLKYAVENNIPFLQGTTLYGAVNRSTYYNGDYDKKYGDLVKPARNSIRGAIQLCAVECAQGRKLNDWEIESILAYLWTIDLKMFELGLSNDDFSRLNDSDEKAENKLALIQSKYASKSEATFIPPPANRKEGSGVEGDVENGEKIYQQSCLHCHENGRYSYLHLDKSKMTRKHLKRNITKYSSHSIYQVTRWGVPSYTGRSSYMPQFPAEKLSVKQLADLRAYLES
jgi:mono/diheme cytochrome c family protein